ncbi:mitogen-activated protein kinase-binding protein 1-like isoform X2 [Stegodyphus dumicola]|uniref:mitogen-activated protein kinase-binding protein 1-like isoform X2 n=1 Tax=Stegodyphus dumicola TaxID=202533 RepID=UPI0015B0D58C|nr:mitogen-activated protein kinase-binding protein 1-like isoform X2 [Stegodyphus dumicola]
MDYIEGSGTIDFSSVGDNEEKVKLERVIGLTVSNNAAFDCDPNSSIVAYPAGCVVVLYNVRKNKQSHILSSSKKTITSLAFSSDGKYLATGECGHQPHVRVWDVQEKVQVAEFQGHKYGINCVAFSPNLKYVVSVGSQHDMIVNVWDWRNNVKVASNKVSCKVKALSFASNGNYFVTVGNRHVKFWYLEYSRSTKYKLEPVPLMGRSAILGDQRNNYFCDVACGKGDMVDSTYAITKSGLLCEFNSRRLLDKWVELRTTSANSISVGENLIFIGCAEGVIRCFNPYSLNFISTLPKPHVLGIDVAKGLVGSKPVSSHLSNIKYPDTIAIALDAINKKVTCVYNDHSLYVWDVKDTKKVGKSHSFMYHSACIWGVEIYPELPEGSKNILPKETFLTCSSDDTIRFWNLEPVLEQDTAYHRNVFSSELLKILYVDPELSYLCDTDVNTSGSNDKVDTTYDGKNGVRCLRISLDGRHLASGDRSGNIRIHDLKFVEELCKIEAHDSEVLCLEYSKPITINGVERKYLASASRDRLIHVFEVKQEYTFQQTLDDHSSSITAVRFVQGDQDLQMISCGADKSIIFRKAVFNPQLSLLREHHVVGKTTLYDMEVDIQQKHILTACQDRNIRVYSVMNGKHGRCFRGSQGEDGTLIKVVLDNSGTYLATSCTDKSLYLYDYNSGECLATMFGHSELVTGLKFTNNGRHLISVSGDGCIFLWRLPIDVTQTMLNKQISEGIGLPNLWQDNRKSTVAVTKPLQLLEASEEKNADETDLVNENNHIEITPPGYRFSVGQLPLWAKKQMLEKLQESPGINQNLPPPVPPRGRWAQRIDGQGLVVRSYLDSDSVIPFPNVPDGSENSSSKQEKEDSSNNEFNNVSEIKNSCFEVSEESVREILNGNSLEETRMKISKVTTRSSIKSLNSLNNRRDKLRPLSSSSNIRLEEIDAEDERSDSEISEMVYYPASEDESDVPDGSFLVCANNENNIKASQKPKHEKLLNEKPIANTSEHIETNSDDEEASTPVDSERSFLSSLCISTENLERLGQREKFMKSNYESLEKTDSVDLHQNDVEDKNLYRQSISAKFLAGSLTPLKRSYMNGAKSPVVPERQLTTPTKKREELLKALNEAKKKLETVGYRSGLSSSKSIADLHSTPDREIFKSPKYCSPEGDIRRAASMTDLSMSAQNRWRLFSTPSKSKEKTELAAPLWNQSKIYHVDISPPASPNQNKTLASPHLNQSIRKTETTHSETLSRSNSASSLYAKNQNLSTSLHKNTLDRSSPQPVGSDSAFSLLSKNSINSSGRHNLPSLPSRHHIPSMVTTAPLATDSSSDSSPTESTCVKNGRPLVSPRPFNFRNRHFSLSESVNSPNTKVVTVENSNEGLQKLKLKSRSEWDLKNSSMEENYKTSDSWQSSRYLSYSPRKNYIRPLKLNPTGASTTGFPLSNSHSSENRKSVNPPEQIPFLAWDPESVPLTPEVCENVAENLTRITSLSMQVFQRLTLATDLPSEEKSAMTNTLAQGVWQAQQNLRPAIPPMNPWSVPMENSYDPSLRKLPGLNFPLSNGDLHDPSVQRPHISTQPDVINTMALLEQYSDKLLSLVEQKISSSHEKPKN